MVKHNIVNTAAFAAIAVIAAKNNIAQSFQPPLHVLSHSLKPTEISSCWSNTKYHDIRSNSYPSSTESRHHHINKSVSSNSKSSNGNNLFRIMETSRSTARAVIRKLRRTMTLLLASFAFFLSSARVRSPPPAHAASLAAATSSTTTSSSWTQKINPFRTRKADELIDAYVRDRLFADDQFDPVESAYREAFADAGKIGDGASSSSSVYPTILAETAGAALGRKDVSSLVSPSRGDGFSGASSTGGKGDGITAALIKSSDFLQRRLGVSASVSYYMIAAGGLLGLSVLPGTVGVLYQGLQRLQIDKSEMKMYGQITDMDATARKEKDDDDDDDEDED